MGALKTSMNSSLRVNGGGVGTVTNAQVESPTNTLGSIGSKFSNGLNFAANADVAATWTVIFFVAAIIFLYVIL